MQIIKHFTDLNWWIGVVVVGILINLVSNVLQRKFDIQLSRTSTWARKFYEGRHRKWEDDLEHVRADQHEQTMCGMIEMRYRLRMLTFWIGGVILWLVGLQIPNELFFQHSFASWAKIVVFLFGSVAMVLSVPQYRGANYYRKLLYHTRKGYDEEVGPDAKEPDLILRMYIRLKKWFDWE